MNELNIWEFNNVYIKPKKEFLNNINLLIHSKFITEKSIKQKEIGN